MPLQPSPKERLSRPVTGFQRDREIARRRRAGALLKVLSVEFGLTEARVSQICRDRGAVMPERTRFGCGHLRAPANLYAERNIRAPGGVVFRCKQCKQAANRSYLRANVNQRKEVT